MTAVTVSVVMGIVAWKLLQSKRDAPLGEWQPGLTAGSVALFGTLIAGVFVITTFRIDRGLGGTNVADAIQAAEDTARDYAERRVGGRVGYDRDASAFAEASPIMPGTPVIQAFAAGDRHAFQLAVSESEAVYQIDARAITDGFDPVLYLYETSGTNR